jgi:signal transduction histidine kinase
VETDGEVRLEVVDDGRGFDPGSVWPGGFGLIGMRERASAVGGSVEIRSAPEAGTQLAARMPADHGRQP